MAQAESLSRTDQRSPLPFLAISAALLIGLALLTNQIVK